jgi:hypothetical protein
MPSPSSAIVSTTVQAAAASFSGEKPGAHVMVVPSGLSKDFS